MVQPFNFSPVRLMHAIRIACPSLAPLPFDLRIVTLLFGHTTHGVARLLNFFPIFFR